jgi:glycine dehydrogenase subunit 2
MSESAVLNANYVLARLKEAYDLPFDRLCMHESFCPRGRRSGNTAARRSTSRSG